MTSAEIKPPRCEMPYDWVCTTFLPVLMAASARKDEQKTSPWPPVPAINTSKCAMLFASLGSNDRRALRLVTGEEIGVAVVGHYAGNKVALLGRIFDGIKLCL